MINFSSALMWSIWGFKKTKPRLIFFKNTWIVCWWMEGRVQGTDPEREKIKFAKILCGSTTLQYAQLDWYYKILKHFT